MKELSKIFLIVILGGILLTTTTCNKKTFAKFPFSGRVFDSLGGTPVGGVSVGLTACVRNDGRDGCERFSYGIVTTDANGYFTFGYIHEAKSNRYFISLNGGGAFIQSAISYSAVSFSHINKDEMTNGRAQIFYLNPKP